MLHTYLAAPFASPTRQQQFEAVATALAAEPGTPFTLLLGNLSLASAPAIDAVLLRPRSLTIVQLVPGGGVLHIPDLRQAPWHLDGAVLELPDEALNPFVRFEQQRTLLARWLEEQLPPEAANLQFITGLVLFGAPVQFGPGVEARMAAVPSASTFHLLPDPARFTRRLAQLATPEIDLTPEDLEQLPQQLGLLAGSAAPASTTSFPTANNLLRQKAGQLWRWLGAEDMADLDRTSTGYEIDLDARNREKEELENLRAQLQQDMQQQLRALEDRENEREQRIAQLQQQLTVAPVAPEAPDLQAQLAAEKREKQVLEASVQTYRTDLETRNQELGAKIQQLENLIERLANSPVTPSPPTTAAASSPPPAAPLPPTGLPVATPTTFPAPDEVPASAPPVAAHQALPSSANEPVQRAQFGRPASARQSLGGAWARWWPVAQRWLAQQQARLQRSPQLRRLPALPKWAGYAAGGTAALVLAVGVTRCNKQDTPTTFEQQGRVGLLAANGDTLVPARYTSIGEFREGRSVVEQDGVFGFVQIDGQEVVKPAYDALYPYADGYARARVGGLYTFLTEQGEEFSTYYFAARNFTEGWAAVLDYQGWHYISGPEEPAAPVIFQEAYSFEQEVARVKTGGKFTFISPDYLADTTAGVAPFGRYTSATDFDAQGRARVVQNGRTFFIDRNGAEIKE
ncbi:WG repeat-containing protein [Hymenobacter swuensis]|uniref:Uncharacterized protein n=1 Tax=Hymenobacter swuensis DY53 TaxID=1227739 RepID=W8F282_9BACT|nr:WG repeat-containing protein [Hymenobacter swuensis]AHJ99489.1 hypothetical protein Hsw_3894 [Hymenobacter swuensis DY53]